jgi:hypothetical protein
LKLERQQALMTAIATGTSWIRPPDKLARLSGPLWTKVHQREVEGWTRQENQDPANISAYWFPEERPTFAVLHYNGLTEDQLVARSFQGWNCDGSSGEPARFLRQ